MHRPIRSILLSILTVAIQAMSVAAAEQISLAPNPRPGELKRVTIQVEAGGHTIVRAEADAQSAKQTQEQKLPMSVSANLQYDERSITPLSDSLTEGTPIAVRYYDRAEAIIKVDQSGRSPKLADDRRLIIAARGADRPVLYCPDGSLTREHLDLIDVIGDAIALDRLLPATPVSTEDSWSNDAKTMAPLLTLDSIAVCEVKSSLESFNDDFAKIRVAGTVQGTVDSAATELEIRAVYLYDRRAQRVAKLNLAVKERRSIGDATPGLDATAKLQIQVESLEKSAQLDNAAIAKAKALNSAAAGLTYESGPLGLRFKHDRKWYVTSEQRETVTLRRVDGGDLVAQCTLAALPPKSAGRQVSLEQFEKDVTFALGKNFGEMVSSRQWQNAAGLYCYELVARGIVDEVPVEWHYYLLAPESGDRVSVAITLEKPMVERVGRADRDLVETIELFPRMPAAQTARKTATNIQN
jgi:hypothetical protein